MPRCVSAGWFVLLSLFVVGALFPTTTTTLSGMGGAGPLLTPPPAPACAVTWHVVPSPDVVSATVRLAGITGSGPHDLWAAGSAAYGGSYPMTRTVAEHWDGTQWSLVPSPNPGFTEAVFARVVARAGNDVWASGAGHSGPAHAEVFVEHWDGSQWTVPFDSPVGGNGSRGTLPGLAVLGPDDVWAVGSYTDDLFVEYQLLVHWDGVQWNTVVTFSPGSLAGVTAMASNDVWAVGKQGDNTTLIKHWDGTMWSVVPSPNIGPLTGVAAVAANDVWAVGNGILHWDGTTWSAVVSPSGSFTGISVGTADDVWAVGNNVVHWDGQTWSLVPGAGGSLAGVAVIPGSDVWVVGQGGLHPLIARYGPPEFSDVPTTHPFYAYVQCLACRQIIAGYADSSFRPESPVTRGQLAKFVSNAAGYNDAIAEDQQSFTDVPPGSPFWIYIQRALAHGVINGYSNGDGTFSFRPGAPVTRGQAAKFVANAANFMEAIPATQQTFSDVPPADPFWLFVERVKAHGVISGYADGTFHPRDVVTRGQTAKFIANALVADCQPVQH
jgi:hypothetical protein